MFSKRVVLIALALVCVLALAAGVIVQAQNGQRGQQPGPPMPGGPGQPRQMDGPMCPVRAFGPPSEQMMARWSNELKLTDDQRKQTADLIQRLVDRIHTIIGETTYMRSLIAEMKSETTSPAKVDDLAAKISKQEADILQAELAMWMEFEKILTPEQRTQLWNIFPRQLGPMSPWPGGRGPGGPGPTPPPPPQ